MKIIVRIFLSLIIPLQLLAADYAKEAKAIEESFVQVLQLYKDGKSQEARELIQNAYFGHFENLEGGIRINISQKKSFFMEKQFGDIRKAIKAGKSPEEIEKMMMVLNKEIEEVLPIIEKGTRLVGEKSDDGGLSAAGMSTSQPQDGSTDKSNPWSPIIEEINQNLKLVLDAYNKNDKDQIKTILNKVKFDLYRNTKLEIAVRRYGSQQLDQMIQQIMGNLITENISLDKNKFTQSIKDINELINSAADKFTADAYALAPAQEEPQEEKVDYKVTVENIKNKMADVLKSYEKGDVKSAISDAGDIYFDEYEASGMENKVGAIDSSLKTTTEASFSKIVSLMKNGSSADKISKEMQNLQDKLVTSLDKVGTNASGWELFIYALIIILREGFEALIIVVAVAAYLIKTGNQNRLSIVYNALVIAVILSFVTAWAVNAMFGSQLAGQSREVIEGSVMLVAVLLLFYVGFWLLSNAGAKKWSTYIKEQVNASLSGGDSKALWWTVFLAVYREGAETVLFYQALIFDAQNSGDISMVAFGFIVGVVILFIAYFLIKAFSIKVPIKQFFMGTSIIIFYMSIVFVGKGVMELVEGKLFIPTLVNDVPTIEWLGLYPYYESIIPQIVMILALIIGVLIMKSKSNKGEKV